MTAQSAAKQGTLQHGTRAAKAAAEEAATIAAAALPRHNRQPTPHKRAGQPPAPARRHSTAPHATALHARTRSRHAVARLAEGKLEPRNRLLPIHRHRQRLPADVQRDRIPPHHVTPAVQLILQVRSPGRTGPAGCGAAPPTAPADGRGRTNSSIFGGTGSPSDAISAAQSCRLRFRSISG